MVEPEGQRRFEITQWREAVDFGAGLEMFFAATDHLTADAEGALLDFQQAAPRGHADLAVGTIKLEWGLFEGGKRVAELGAADSKIRAAMAQAIERLSQAGIAVRAIAEVGIVAERIAAVATAERVDEILIGTGREVQMHLRGGDLEIEWREADNHVYMTGPAVEVFSGEWKM